MSELMKEIEQLGVLPVVVINDAKHATGLGKALMNGGLPAAEVTFRTEAAEESIAILAKEFPSMLVGAGTILSVEQVKRAVNAGAKFIVTPGFDEEVVDYCLEHKIPVVPGCITPSELSLAYKRGMEVVKFFPAEPMGGLNTIKAVAAPFTTMRFMPTGGVSLANLESYLKNDKILCCGGSWLVKSSYIDHEEFDTIERLVKETVEAVEKIRKG